MFHSAMPLGEVVGELLLWPVLEIILEIVVHVLAYWLGNIALTTISFGRLPIAPIGDFKKKSRRKRKKGSKKRSWDWAYGCANAERTSP